MIRSHYQSRRHAFTLIELLAVIIIIGILLAAASSLVIPRPTPSQAAEITAAALEQVRMDAIATGLPSALLILADPDDDRPQKIQAVRRSISDESEWEVVGTSSDLGSGILFRELESTSDTSGTAVAKVTLPLRGGAMGEGSEWFTFGFSADGTPLQPGARLVFARGTDGEFSSPEEDAAIIISNNGRPTPAFDFASLNR